MSTRVSRWSVSLPTSITLAGISLISLACAPAEPPPTADQLWIASHPAFVAGETVQEQVARFHADGLPPADKDKIAEVSDLLDAITVGGSIGNRASRSISEMEPQLRTSALLGLVEERLTPVPIQQMAYGWLRDHGVEAMMPRLTLRLKYEKDSWSVVCVAHTLLGLGNGAGLQALINVLGEENADESRAAARTYAATILKELPVHANWTPSDDFASNWQRLLEVNQTWATQRRLTLEDDDPTECSPALRTEYWRMIERLISQRLRPVDDARFVLMRQRGYVIPLLLDASRDPDRYVREHALQTLSWLGPPIGHWSEAHQLDYVATVLPTLADRKCRTRALEALGAAGLAEAAEPLWAWVQMGSREEQAAAADGLLRCASDGSLGEGRSLINQLDSFLHADPAPSLGPEAAFSLYALWMDLQPGLEAEFPVEVWDALPETERQRRQRWTDQRAFLVGRE